MSAYGLINAGLSVDRTQSITAYCITWRQERPVSDVIHNQLSCVPKRQGAGRMARDRDKESRYHRVRT
jgi:hypothetical protein